MCYHNVGHNTLLTLFLAQVKKWREKSERKSKHKIELNFKEKERNYGENFLFEMS